MHFSFMSKKMVNDDLRSAFAELIRPELTAREPAEGVALLDEEPEQLAIHFPIDED